MLNLRLDGFQEPLNSFLELILTGFKFIAESSKTPFQIIITDDTERLKLDSLQDSLNASISVPNTCTYFLFIS